ncbi:hypothetical protein BV898_09113 [Hypsibius exemplaris]|uniref:Gustatory receptor n=1 Tax=Hypsibius exemplaris TaxID=2072580 RepID=A0A1W0WNI6_HYPEX|nr:hypothetical protein BV898_09113 [Hypsibius exemplaris]
MSGIVDSAYQIHRRPSQKVPLKSPKREFFPDYSEDVPCDEELLQPWMYRFLQLIGAHPRSADPVPVYSARSSTSPPLKVPLVLWSVGIVLFSGFSYAAFVASEWEMRRKLLTNLEFFELITFLFSLCDVIHSPLLLVLFLLNSHKFVPLVRTIEHVMNHVMLKRDIKKVRFILVPCFVWYTICTMSVNFAQYWYTYSYGRTVAGPNYNLTEVLVYPSNEWPMRLSVYGITIWDAVAVLVFINSDWMQHLLVVLVYAVASTANQVKRDVKRLSPQQAVDHQLKGSGAKVAKVAKVVLQRSRLSYRRLRGIVLGINDVFSAIVLATALRDLVTMVSFIATLLRRWVKEDGETQEDYEERYIDAQSGLLSMYVHMFVVFGNAASRMGVFLYCSSQESALRKALHGIHADCVDEAVDEECRAFLGESNWKNMAISGGGFFYITKEFLATMIGMLFTYTILIYQTREGKGNMMKLMTSEQLKTRLRQITADFNETVQATLDRCKNA